MRLSVVIPTFNRRERVTEALRSVLNQTRLPDELIVVDDGSSDGTADFLRESFADRIRIIQRPNGGPAAARNTGISAAEGDLVAFLDSDDVWQPQTMERFLGFFHAHPKVAFVFGDLWIDPTGGSEGRLDLYEPGLRGRLLRSAHCLPHFFMFQLERDLTLTSTLAARRTALLALGGFDERFQVCEDMHLWLRAARRFAFGFIPEILAHRRRHSSNLVNDWTNLERSRIRMLEDLLSTLPDLTRRERRAIRGRLAASRYDLGSWHFHRREFPEAKAHLDRCTGLVCLRPACLYKRLRSRFSTLPIRTP